MHAPAAVLRAVRDEAQHAEIDLDAAHRSDWWHRPFTEAELDAHPDGLRIRATVEIAIADAVARACVMVEAAFEDGGQ